VPAEVGAKAPGSTLPKDEWENKAPLEDFTKEGPVAHFFYPGDWSSTSSTKDHPELDAVLADLDGTL
jgi:peroxiredoxin